MVKTHKTIHSTYYTIVHFKRLGSRQFHKEKNPITEGYNGMEMILCKHSYSETHI